MVRRASVLGGALALAILVIVVSTDEQSISWGARLGRLASLMAVAGALGAFVTAEQSRARGEIRAAMALGATPFRACAGATLGGVAIAMLGPILVLCRSVDLTPLFPQVGADTDTFRILDAGSVLETSRGVVLRADGCLVPLAGEARQAIGGTLPRLATALAMLVLAVSAPCWASLRCGFRRRLASGTVTGMTCMLAFNLVAAGRISAWALPLAPLVLLADAIDLGYRQRG